MLDFLTVYSYISVLLAACMVLISCLSFARGKRKGRFLGMCSLSAAVVDISYLMSLRVKTYFLVSVSISVYSVFIDWMLIFLIGFMREYTDYRRTRAFRILGLVLSVYAYVEVVLFAVNPFHEFVVGFNLQNYAFIKHPMYIVHLAYTYFMVGVAVEMTVRQIHHVSRAYRVQYNIFLFSLALVILVNGVFLFVPRGDLSTIIDYSVPGYAFVLLILYWSAFVYPERYLLSGLAMSILGNIDQGILLFDYNKRLLMKNARAESMLSISDADGRISLDSFSERFDLPLDFDDIGSGRSLQCTVPDSSNSSPLRCDCSRISDNSGFVTGYLLVFTDMALDTDLLTGFHSWSSFSRFASENPQSYPEGSVVCVCDINNLSFINMSSGNAKGDESLKKLADSLKKNFPNDTYFVRGRDAMLITISYHETVDSVRTAADAVFKGLPFSVEYAFGTTGPDRDILGCIGDAEKAMQINKLLDVHSTHSQILSTLIRALEETDPDTEAHVKRTRESGVSLGRIIGLSDLEQSKLSLLCLLHDIGKIGIPLEILNKPGKLNAQEWQVMCSHVDKGYQITKSSSELSCISEEVLHHHERWDGKGYPSGLRGDAIPLLSRIISVIDAYDAMINDRCYRKALPEAAAREELKACSGSQFDPNIVAAFLQSLDEKPLADSTDTPAEAPRIFPDSEGKYSDITFTHLVPYARYIADENDCIFEINDNFTAITGYTRDDLKLIKLTPLDLIPKEDRESYNAEISEMVNKNGFAYVEHRIIRKDGSIGFVLCFGRRYYDSAAKANRSEILIADSSAIYSAKMRSESEERYAEQELLNWQASCSCDPLTKLLTYYSFKMKAEEKIKAGGTRAMLLTFDIDLFKKFNAAHGHSAGDELLILTSQAIRSALRSSDLASRSGGDEFSIILFFRPDSEDHTMIERASQIFDRVSLTGKGVYPDAGISMGVAFSNDSIRSFQNLFDESNAALTRAKDTGRGRFCISEKNR